MVQPVSVPWRYGAPSSGGKRAGAVLLLLLLAAPPAAAQTVVAALGDSLTRGYGLPDAEGFVPELQSWLAEREAGVEMVNAGVSGDTTANGLARVEWTLTPEVDAMIVALGGNDLLRAIDPATAKRNLRGILEAAEAAEVPVLLVGMRAPGNYGADYKAAFDAIYPSLAQEFDTLYADDFLGAIADLPDRAAAAEEFMQADGIHPNAAGVERIVADLGPEVLDLVAAARR